jgi:hypothetical protein
MALSDSKPKWHFNQDYDKIELPDPRIAIAKHIGWTAPAYVKENKGYTEWSTPEPDGFSAALFALRPYECPFVENHVWYYDQKRQGWFSVFYVDKIKKIEWLRWSYKLPWIAQWTVFKYSQIRKSRPMTEIKGRKGSDEITLNQRLHQMNFYSSLISKSEECIRDAVKERIGGIA